MLVDLVMAGAKGAPAALVGPREVHPEVQVVALPSLEERGLVEGDGSRRHRPSVQQRLGRRTRPGHRRSACRAAHPGPGDGPGPPPGIAQIPQRIGFDLAHCESEVLALLIQEPNDAEIAE